MVTSLSVPGHAASFVLGKQYLLKPKRQLTSLVWYAVTFDKSITGGLKVTLKVFSEQGKSLEFLDDFRDFVSSEIADRCISKFSLTEYRIEFDESKKSSIGFNTNSISDVMYLPLKVKYENGFEDYLVRIRIRNGKFAISTRPLQHGKLILPGENAVENYRAEKEQERQKQKQQAEAKKAKQDAEQRKREEELERAKLKEEMEAEMKAAPNLLINEELFNTEDSKLEELLKSSESEFKAKEEKALDLTQPINFDENEGGAGSMDTAPAETLNAPKNVPANDIDPNEGFMPQQGSEAAPAVNDQPTSLAEPQAQPAKVEESAFEDDEIEIEGFDEALEEIERLEKLGQ